MVIDNVRQFLSKLEGAEINFCVWKNLHLETEMLLAQTDIDLFIPSTERLKFHNFIHESNGVEVVSHSANFPSIHHYYVRLGETQILHLHVYYKLYSGASHVKEFHLPIEQILMSTRRKHQNLRFIPSVEVENWLTIIRYYLKKSSFLGFLLYIKEKRDYDLQNSRINFGAGVINVAGLEDVGLHDPLESSHFKCFTKGLMIRKKLKDYRRIGIVESKYLSMLNLLGRVVAKIRKDKKSLARGGVLFAITGVDGCGKSSLVGELAREFSKKFNVRTVHFGRPPPTVATLPIRLALLLRRWSLKTNPVGNQNGRSEFSSDNIYGLISGLRQVILAYERYALSKKVLRYISKGYVVISDRYPSCTVGKMDSPKLTIANSKYTFLCNWENYYYSLLPKADLIINLEVSDETALSRNKQREKSFKESDAEVIARRRHNVNLIYDSKQYINFDNNSDKNSAISFIRDQMWRTITVYNS